ncbi:unnamed protein product [Timema podura]|uniref:Uncharacterized protein n=1 Tax=Timema podura TaxID=61482 RepID=A0ABN7NFI7_TIMPD|nr:unnamed protein product [Timema podura]
MIRTVDTGVPVLAIRFLSQLQNVEKLWVSIGIGKHQHIVAAHEISSALGPENSAALPMFHVFITFLTMARGEVDMAMPLIEKFVILMHGRTNHVGNCSEECGTGVQTRRVHCSVDLHCDLGLRPDDTRACSSDKQCSGKWFAGPWGQCSPGCGQGHQTRDVVCVAFIRGQHHVALYMNCPENLKPDTDRVCESNSCAPDWFITEWGQCSRECGTGVQKREVKCLDDKQQLSSGCAEDARPPSRRVCNTHDCSTGFATEKSSSHPLSRIDDDPSLSNGAGDQALPDETLHKGTHYKLHPTTTPSGVREPESPVDLSGCNQGPGRNMIISVSSVEEGA